MSNKTKFCQTCNDEVTIELGNTTLTGEVKGDSYRYEGVEPSTACGHFIPDDEIDKHNLKLLNATYRKHNNIISLEQVQELPRKYDIGKRPLSNLLEWGELTFTRYFNGDIPSKAYSDLLKEIYNNPLKYLSILEANKELISAKTYEKSKLATQNSLKNNSIIHDVYNYILQQCDDITPLALQMLLYYCQGFCFAFFDTILFDEDCIITPNSVVYTSFLENLSPNDYSYKTEFNLTKSQQLLIDSVIKYFACYSSMTLTKFITNEPPYLKTCEDSYINRNDLFDYFSLIKNKYDMISLLDIKNYTTDIFRNEN